MRRWIHALVAVTCLGEARFAWPSPAATTKASSNASEQSLEPTSMPSPAPAGSNAPNLFARGERVYLTWAQPGAGAAREVRFAVLQDGAWSESQRVASGDRLQANWANSPAVIELADGARVAEWLWKDAPGAHTFGVQVARATPGQAWPAGLRPHRDHAKAEHGFVSLIPGERSTCTVVWLDGRESAGKEEGTGNTHLRAAELGPDGLQEEVVLDPRVCDCCQTSGVRTARGALIAYRDRSAEEVRDIWLVRQENGHWTKPYVLSHDGWKIQGCPVNGPALDADGTRVAAAWFAMAGDNAVVRVALSDDAGAHFGGPVRVDNGKSIGHVDVALLPDGGALAVWVESESDGSAEIRARRVDKQGEPGASAIVAKTSSARGSGIPQLVRAGNTLYFAWTGEAHSGIATADKSGKPQVQLASLAIPAAWR